MMGGYFKPWRRKLGVVTLVTACVFMGLWVRSLRKHDQFVLWDNNEFGPAWLFASRAGELYIQSSGHPFGRQQFWQAIDIPPLSTPVFGMTMPSFGRFGTLVAIPYWPITIPATAISAWLLLSKPRKSTSMKVTDSVPVEGK